MTNPNDDVLEPLRDLPSCDTDAHTTERIRKTAVAAFVSERDLAQRPWWTTLAIRTGRVVTPVFLAGTVGVYLTWAIGVAISVYN